MAGGSLKDKKVDPRTQKFDSIGESMKSQGSIWRDTRPDGFISITVREYPVYSYLCHTHTRLDYCQYLKSIITVLCQWEAICTIVVLDRIEYETAFTHRIETEHLR